MLSTRSARKARRLQRAESGGRRRPGAVSIDPPRAPGARDCQLGAVTSGAVASKHFAALYCIALRVFFFHRPGSLLAQTWRSHSMSLSFHFTELAILFLLSLRSSFVFHRLGFH